MSKFSLSLELSPDWTSHVIVNTQPQGSASGATDRQELVGKAGQIAFKIMPKKAVFSTYFVTKYTCILRVITVEQAF